MRYLSADVGGTFTDLVLYDDESGALTVEKLPSTAGSADAITTGIGRILQAAGQTAADVGVFVHGFTIATNALLTRSGADTVLVVTKGFRDVLEIGDQRRREIYALTEGKPPPLAARSRVVEVDERIGAFGEVVVPLESAELDRVAASVAALQPEAVAISLIFSHRDPAHEQALLAAIKRALPDVPAYLSSDVNRQIDEYARTNTTTIAAYVGPQVKRYVEELSAGLERMNLTAPLLLMRSDGGVSTPAATLENPAHMLLSGPAGGVIAGAALGRVLGASDLVTFDMGGTSADFSLIQAGEPRTTSERVVAGEPLRLPSLDIETISAGGGSIAEVDVGGALTVGPQSAGAVPGPACYQKGGNKATVTDAIAVLGILSADATLAGGLKLDVDRARDVVGNQIAKPLGLTVEAAARGIVSVSTAQMVEAVKTLSMARGCDVRQFSLLACGGAGPVFAAFIAEQLGMAEVLVPPRPGVFAANGLLMCDIRHTMLQPYPMALSAADDVRIAAQLDEMATGLDAALTRDGVAEDDRLYQLAADMRCIGQFHELPVPLPQPDGQGWLDKNKLAATFHAAHELAYGHADLDVPVEIVSLRVEAIGRMPKARFQVVGNETSEAPVPIGQRPVFLNADQGFQPCDVYRRRELRPGHLLPGPAVIVQRDSTVLVLSGQQGQMTRHGVIRIKTRSS